VDIIVTHENADFDGLACLVAARKLYPGSVAVCPSVLDRSVREYVLLHNTELGLADGSTIDLEDVSRLVAVDTSEPSRLGRFADLAKDSQAELITLDHHAGRASTEAGHEVAVASTDGALITTLIGLLAERRLEIGSAEATLFALGIHQDTSSLTYEGTTARDVEALAYCHRRGADIGVVERYTRVPLRSDERDVLRRLLSACETLNVRGVPVLLAVARCEACPDGSAHVADRLMDLTEARALVCLLEYDGKTSCIIRSRGTGLEAGTLARALGGGGHRHAAGATLTSDLDSARATVERNLAAAVSSHVTARDLMSAPVLFVTPDASVSEAMATCRRTRVGGLLVGTASALRGVVSREDLDGAMAHELAHAPVKAVMRALPRPVSPDATVDELRQHLARSGVDRVAVEENDRVVGVVTRRDLLGEPDQTASRAEPVRPSKRLDLNEAIPAIRPVIAALDAVGGRRVFLVGGGVRDALLGTPVVDIDLAVEGSGIELARRLASKLDGRATPYGEFGTATVTYGDQAVDVATTRSEFYASPAALPSVEDAPIESDLFRRDFTINAMAIALEPEERGRLVDPFGGERDLASGTLRVLHGLSFVDDPTRLLRAARYEARYGFKLDGGSESLARSCVALGLVGELSGARIGHELAILLREKTGLEALRRLDELGVVGVLHGGLNADSADLSAMRMAEATNDELDAGAQAWRLRVAVMTRDLGSSERYRWLSGLQLAGRDVEVIVRAATLPASLVSKSTSAESTRELYGLLSEEPIEAVVLALASAPTDSPARERLRRYLVELRHVRLAITGDDLAVLGLAESPAVGRVLDAVLGLKLDGEVTTTEEELAAAQRLIEAGNLL